MIQDYLNELKKKYKPNFSGIDKDREIISFIWDIYNGINNGQTRKCVCDSIAKLLTSLKSDISEKELDSGIKLIEAIFQTILHELIREGELYRLELKDKNKIIMHWEKKIKEEG